jgi:hypothetical protein
MQISTSSEGLEYAFAYGYSQRTWEFTQPLRVYRSGPGLPFSLPPFSTLVAPPGELAAHLVSIFNPERDAWTTATDFRAARLYAKATGAEVRNSLSIGDAIPDALTIEAPPDLESRRFKALTWSESDGTWALVDDFSQVPLWRKATAQLALPIPQGKPLPGDLTPFAPPSGEGVRWDDKCDRWTSDSG